MFEQLKAAGTVRSQSDFSKRFCHKSKCWLAYQRHRNRDFTVSAAIACLTNVRRELAILLAEQAISDKTSIHEIDALQNAESELRRFLAAHGIAETIRPPQKIETDLFPT
ncbi:MAG: DUF6626 family protein [Brucella sp.]